MIELQTLGATGLRRSSGEDVRTVLAQPKRLALLAYLAVATPRGCHSKDTLRALFWPEADDHHARRALNRAVYFLRHALGDDAVVSGPGDSLGVNRDALWCDAVAFEEALDAGRAHEAVALYGGDLLDGFFTAAAPEFERWLEHERQRLRERAAQAAWAVANAQAGEGHAVTAERWARRAADLAPADETIVRRLMTFLQRLGDRAAAVRAYETFAQRLAREYELAPSAETQALSAAIRQEQKRFAAAQDASPAPPPSGVGNAGEGAAARSAEGPGRGHRRMRRWGVIPTLLVAVLLAGGLGYGVMTLAGGETGNRSRGPRILVLPFQNLGAAKDAYFADGITDEITARLAMVKGLSVVGGQAALRYKGTDKTPRQMAEETQVDYVLEGTVSWQRGRSGPGRVRVRPQLINARDETQVWAVVLDEDVNMPELFALLSGITRRVVDELHVVLEGPQEQVLSTIPTRSLEAYDYFLRGRTFAHGAWLASNNRAAIELLQRAVERDSTFALAYAWLSFSHTEAHWLHSMGAHHLELAKAAADRALRLDPRLPDVHTALGHYYYACCNDYRQALSHLERSYTARPGDAQVVMFIGNVYKRQGRWGEALRFYEQAAGLDPAWKSPLLNLSQTQLWLRRYDDAERTSRRALSLEPREAFAYTIWASVSLLRDGDVAAARRIVGEAAAVSDGYGGMRLPFYVDLLDRRYAAAGARLGGKLGPLESGDDWLVNDQIRRAVVSRLLGDSGAAQVHFDSGRVEVEAALRGDLARFRQRHNWLRSGLAICYAGLGRRDAALEQARQVLASDPPAVDAISGPAALQDVALAYVMLGDRAAALDVIERLLSIPARFSPQLLRLDPLWDPLRGDPRFERLARGRS